MRRSARWLVLAGVACSAGLAVSVVPSMGAGEPLRIGPTDLSWDFVDVGSESAPKAVNVLNQSAGPVGVDRVVLRGRDPGSFRIRTNGCAGRTLAPGDNCEVTFSFRPTQAGTQIARARIVDTVGCDRWIALAGGTPEPAPAPRARAAACPAQGAVQTVTAPGTTTTLPGATTNTAASRNRCRSRRRFTTRFKPPKGPRIVRASATLAGGRVSIRRVRDTWNVVVDLRGKPAGRYAVVARLTDAEGKVTTRRRNYNACVPTPSASR